MRSLLLAAAVALLTVAPAQAQVGFVPLVGYDIDYGSPTIGVAVNLGVTPAILPIAVSIRPSAEYLFLNDDSGLGLDADGFRLNGDLIGRFAAPGLPVQPYGKAGIGAEIVTAAFEGSSETNTNVGANLGIGAEANRFLAEFTIGVGSISSSRIAVGYRF